MTLQTRPISRLPVGASFARFCQVIGSTRSLEDAQARASLLRDSPLVGAAIEWRRKSAVAPIHSENFSSALVESGLSTEVLELLRGRSIFDMAVPLMRRAPFLLDTPIESSAPAPAGSWIGEGMSVPISIGSYDTVRLKPFKLQTAIVASRELLEVGNVAAESVITNALIGALASTQDAQFLDPSVGPTAASPPSITFAATEVISSGTTAAQMTADFHALIDAITTSGRGLRFVLKQTTAARVGLTLGAASDLPRTLCSIPVILSSTSPAQIALIDFAEVTFAEDGLDVDRAAHASVEMDTAPSNRALQAGSPSDPPTATTLVSLWQANLAALRISRFLDWQTVRTGAVSYMVTSY